MDQSNIRAVWLLICPFSLAYLFQAVVWLCLLASMASKQQVKKESVKKRSCHAVIKNGQRLANHSAHNQKVFMYLLVPVSVA